MVHVPCPLNISLTTIRIPMYTYGLQFHVRRPTSLVLESQICSTGLYFDWNSARIGAELD